jgi:hypothetical protein
MNDPLFDRAKRLLRAEGPCRFDVPQNAQFEWMKAQCLMWTGGQLKIMGARTVTARVRIMPVGESRLIVWDYEDLAQHENLHFLLQFDNDDELNILAHVALYNFAALILFAHGHFVHSGQLVRGARSALPNKAAIETRQKQRKPYDSQPITVGGYLLFFHEQTHYTFRNPSLSRDRYFQVAAERIENLRRMAERSLSERDFRSIRGPRGGPLVSSKEADDVYPRNLIEFLGKNETSPAFVEEVACDLFAIEQLLKSHRTDKTPAAVARLYAAVMMHYQIQATLESLRKIYERIEEPGGTTDIGQNTENQIRNDIRGFYLNDKISEILNPEPLFWPAYDAEVTRLYREGLSKRYWQSVVMSAGVDVIAKAHDKAWLADCEQRDKKLSDEEREGIGKALEADFGF